MVGVGAAIFLLTAGTAWFEAAERTGAFSLAILRRDGILVPFASYDGKTWSNSWPVVGQAASVPITLADTPKGWWPDKRPLLDWTLFPIRQDGPTLPRTVHANAVNFFRAGCQSAVGLFTDYKPATLPPPLRVHPYPKDALAYAGDVQISPIEVIPPTDSMATALAKELPEEITPKEDAMVSQFVQHNWYHSYTERERHDMPVKVEALYRVPRGLGRDLYYFEAVKRYLLPKNSTLEKGAQCDLITFAYGWFMNAMPKKALEIKTRVVVTSCDYRGVNFLLPLGTVTVNSRPLWIVQWSNATFESYAVMEPGMWGGQGLGLRPLIETPGGACAAGSDEERN